MNLSKGLRNIHGGFQGPVFISTFLLDSPSFIRTDSQQKFVDSVGRKVISKHYNQRHKIRQHIAF